MRHPGGAVLPRREAAVAHCAGTTHGPTGVVLDEPTIGLDPIASQEFGNYIPELAGQGKTILLTTHYMAEADMLCDTIAIISRGRLIAMGTPNEVKRRFSRIGVIEVTVRRAREGLIGEVSRISGVAGVISTGEGALQKLTISVSAGTDAKDSVAETIGDDDIDSLVVRDPTLEEAYINILR